MTDMTEPRPNPSDPRAELRSWAMLLHLSMFAGYLVPMAGFVAPIVIWQVKKSELPGLDAHGRAAANWLISYVVYSIVSLVLVLCCVGIPMLIALILVGVIFPIVAAVKAGDDEVWKYPFSIPFFG